MYTPQNRLLQVYDPSVERKLLIIKLVVFWLAYLSFENCNGGFKNSRMWCCVNE